MKKILKIVLSLFLILVLFVIGFVAYLSINEYYPKENEDIKITDKGEKSLKLGDSISLLTFNVGYCSLDKDHDFFMDGGKTVNTESKQNILDNVEGIKNIINRENPDVTFLQEVDKDSKRSYHVDQVKAFSDIYSDDSEAFATNFLCDYIPYPVPTIGKVNGGILTLNKYNATSATRIPLETSYKWPIRVCQLKRCLLVERVPIENSDKELVLINLHLEAYADEESKDIQTKVLADILKQEYKKGNYCIAGGDFNQSFSNVDPDLYPVKNTDYFEAELINEDYFGSDFSFVNDASTPTSRLLNEPYDEQSENTQYYVIDGFLVSSNIKVDSVKTLDEGFVYSDHNPVKMEVTLK